MSLCQSFSVCKINQEKHSVTYNKMLGFSYRRTSLQEGLIMRLFLWCMLVQICAMCLKPSCLINITNSRMLFKACANSGLCQRLSTFLHSVISKINVESNLWQRVRIYTKTKDDFSQPFLMFCSHYKFPSLDELVLWMMFNKCTIRPEKNVKKSD